jgi:LacI family transcriptional regulator
MDETKGPVTLQDVARHAGVSLATASRALNGSTRTVRPELRSRVMTSATLLNYTPNAQAQAVARGRTSVVGLIVHDIADPYFSTIAAGLMEAADESGMLVTLASTRRKPGREVQHVASLRAQRARAVIIVGSRLVDGRWDEELKKELKGFESGGGRVVLVSQPGLEMDTIVMDNRAGAESLATSLVGLGYQRHAVLAGPSDLVTAVDRVEGYIAGLAAATSGLQPPVLIQGDFTRDGGYEAMEELIPAIGELDCVFAVNDIMAVGAMAALRAHGLQAPHDIAIAGFDDIATLRDIAPSLTTVRMPLNDIGSQALQLVMQESGPRPRTRHVRGDVVLRDSTPPRARR